MLKSPHALSRAGLSRDTHEIRQDQASHRGEQIRVNPDSSISVPDQPIIPFIEGDGIGVDVTPVMQKVVDAAVQKSYGGKRRIVWMEIYAGEKALSSTARTYLPDETLRPCASTWSPSRDP